MPPSSPAFASPVAFAGSRLDRADHIRSSPEALAALKDARARLLRMEGLDPVLTDEGTLTWTSLAEAAGDGELVFLGIEDGRGHFAEVPGRNPPGGLVAGPASWSAMALLDEAELAAYGCARALVGWHARHRFCAVCGSHTVPAKGGWQRDCTNAECKAQHFPRVDPVTIMLVEHDDGTGPKVLLGRQSSWPEGRYSALAGFLEPGESIEEAVAREVFEEAGVRTRDERYVVSQPWPFPSSLMIACHAMTDDPAVTVDRTELDDARWFTRAEVVEALEALARGETGKAFAAPPPSAVANLLLIWWLARD